MGWIDDVVTRTTIRSVWGNGIRDAAVLHYATVAERDATAHPVDGMVCSTTADRRVWQYRADLAKWVIVLEPWQGWVPQGFVGTAGPLPVQADLAESKMDGDQVTVRWLVKVLNSGYHSSPVYISLPPTRGNAAPQQLPAGIGSATDFGTGLTYTVSFHPEFGRVFARKMDGTSFMPSPPGGGDCAFSGTLTYRASGYGP